MTIYDKIEAIASELNTTQTPMGTLYAARLRALLPAPDITDVPDIPPHRFAMFDKGEHWALGRGLEIAPVHLPAMLDKMSADGYDVAAVFGGTDITKLAILFRRSKNGVA